MKQFLFVLGLIGATPAVAATCGVGEYLNGDVCTPIDIGYYGVGCTELPDGYTQLEYIEGTGTQWIDSGYIPTINTSFKFGVNATLYNSGALIGNYGTSDTTDYRIFNGKYDSNDTTRRIWFDFNASRLAGGTFLLDTYYDFEVGNNYVIQDGTKVLSGTTQSSVLTKLPLYIFGKPGNAWGSANTTGARAKIYYVQIFENNILQMKFIPVQNNTTLELGMYDLVEGKFYTNDGTGEFIPGPPYDCATQTQCEPGYYCINGGRRYCLIGQYSDIYGATECINCTNRPDNSKYTTPAWGTVQCPWVCNDGYLQTAANTCNTLCTAGATSLRTDTGVNVPLFASRNTTPSINIGIGDNVCYVDLVDGTADGAINVQYDSKTYHTVAP